MKPPTGMTREEFQAEMYTKTKKYQKKLNIKTVLIKIKGIKAKIIPT